MHRMSPGVERAVTCGREWADRLGSESVRLSHLLLALLDEDEGRPAVLLGSVGLDVSVIRGSLQEILDAPIAPPETTLFSDARDWSVAHRHDPEFLTDAFLLTVLRADVQFDQKVAAIGLNAMTLEHEILRRDHAHENSATEFGQFDTSFEPPSATVEIDVARILDVNFNRGARITPHSRRLLPVRPRRRLPDPLLEGTPALTGRHRASIRTATLAGSTRLGWRRRNVDHRDWRVRSLICRGCRESKS